MLFFGVEHERLAPSLARRGPSLAELGRVPADPLPLYRIAAGRALRRGKGRDEVQRLAAVILAAAVRLLDIQSAPRPQEVPTVTRSLPHAGAEAGLCAGGQQARPQCRVGSGHSWRSELQGLIEMDFDLALTWAMKGWHQIFFHDPEGNVIEVHQIMSE